MKRSLTLIAVVALLVVVSVFVFAACMPSDPAKAQAKYKDKGYSATLITDEIALAIAELALPVKIDGDLAASLTVSNKSYAGEILYFEKSADAKKYADYKKENSSSYVKKDGKAVFVGDKEAYKMKAAA